MPQIDASYSYRTYGGVLEGIPSPKQMIAKAEQEAKDLWGERKTLVLEPTVKGGRLATWTHMVWFSSSEPVQDDQAHGSELCIIWWSEFAPDTDRVLQAIDWRTNAQDYWV
jgi:hypothetical protein